MYVIIWEFRVAPDHVTEFESVYSRSGRWAQLFANASGYIGTELVGDTEDRLRYLTID